MSTYLARHVHAARLDGGLVLLDTQRDAYVCAPLLGTGAEGDTLDTLEPQLLASLRAQGLVTSDGAQGRIWHNMADNRDRLDADELPPMRIGRGDVGRFAASLARSGRVFTHRSFAEMLILARRPPSASDNSTDPQRHARLAQIFDRLSLLLPFRMQCLFRSFCLSCFLRANGLDATWVFGVALYPFRAHCWLEHGRTLVGEQSHAVLPYRRILEIKPGSA